MEFLEYQKPTSIEEVETALHTATGPVKLIAGGTDVLVQARDGDPYKDYTFIDIYGIPGLSQITETATTLRIGAGITHAEITASPLVQQYAGILADACNTIGSPQIRNHATIGGNIANASPAADTLAALAVLDAALEIRCHGELRQVSIFDVIERPNRTKLNSHDLITCILIPKLPAGCRYQFYKLGRRKALSISRMTIATVLQSDSDGVVRHFCMTMGATFPRPMVFPEINAMLLNKRPTEDDIQMVSLALSDKIPEIAGIRPSTIYKQPVCRKLCVRILHQLLGGEQHA
ncbi:MAG: FAD binding domain-containing protein [Clostridia bacterium]